MSWCTWLRGGIVLTAVALGLGTFSWTAPAQQQAEQPTVEVVFCLDTTGSMSGLIDAAKAKIWAISNQIVQGKPTPRVKIGLVAYRDRGDAYVTQVHDLNDNLDAIYSHLLKFQAAGGGDFPESVNQALHESVTKITWSKNKKTLKLIFLVGDAPPHTDYPDDVKYQDTCKLAVTNDIIINTVQCGKHADTERYWREICRLAEGSYVQIDASGGPVIAVATPFDGDLAKINAELAKSTLVFGSTAAKKDAEASRHTAMTLPPAAAAERAGFAGSAGITATYDLLDSIKSGKVKLNELKKEELPLELQKLTPKERETYLDKLDKQRLDLTRRAAELDYKRQKYIADKLNANGKNQAANSFDGQVLRILQSQASRVNIQYGVSAPSNKK